MASVKINFRFYVNLRVPSSYQQTMPCLVLHSSSGGLCRKVPQLTQEGRGTWLGSMGLQGEHIHQKKFALKNNMVSNHTRLKVGGQGTIHKAGCYATPTHYRGSWLDWDFGIVGGQEQRKKICWCLEVVYAANILRGQASFTWTCHSHIRLWTRLSIFS